MSIFNVIALGQWINIKTPQNKLLVFDFLPRYRWCHPCNSWEIKVIKQKPCWVREAHGGNLCCVIRAKGPLAISVIFFYSQPRAECWTATSVRPGVWRRTIFSASNREEFVSVHRRSSQSVTEWAAELNKELSSVKSVWCFIPPSFNSGNFIFFRFCFQEVVVSCKRL